MEHLTLRGPIRRASLPEYTQHIHTPVDDTPLLIFVVSFSLQHRRTPVLGDEVYGNKDWNRRLQQSTGLTRPLLHARSLEFKHPGTGELISLAAPLPADVAAVVKRIYPQVRFVLASLSIGQFFVEDSLPRVSRFFARLPWYWRSQMILFSPMYYEHLR